MRFDASPFTRQCKKEDRKAEGFQILHFYWPFSSDITAVKGLTANIIIITDGKIVSLVVSVTTGELPELYFNFGVNLRQF